MIKSKIRNKFCKFLSIQKYLANKKVKFYCNSLDKQTKNAYFETMTNEGISNNRSF